MAQYRIYTDGTNTYRIGVRDGAFRIDQALTATAFDGIENEDWECLVPFSKEE